MVLFCVCLNSKAQLATNVNSARDMIQLWKAMPFAENLKTFTFQQKTIRYKNNSPIDTSIWHEAMSYPKSFRLDLKAHSGDFNTYRSDSVYIFRNGYEVDKRFEIQPFMLMTHGYKHYATDSTIMLLNGLGVDTALFHERKYRGYQIYVIGANLGDTTKPQVWLDVNRRVVLRQFIDDNKNGVIDVRFVHYKKMNGIWIEFYLEFYRSKELMQTEEYYNVKVNPKLNMEIFNPKKETIEYWY